MGISSADQVLINAVYCLLCPKMRFAVGRAIIDAVRASS